MLSAQEEKMAKGKVKRQNSDSSAPDPPRSLRSRKRGCPGEEVAETKVQRTIRHQDTGETNAVVNPKLLLQESTSTQHQAAEQTCPTKQDPVAEENPADPTDVTVTDAAQEETTVANPNNGSKLEECAVDSDNDADKSEGDKVKITAENCKRSPTQTGNDQLQVFAPNTEEGDGSFSTDLEERADGNENSYSNLLINVETSREEPTNAYRADLKITTKEAAAGLPAKKKRRMGTCGLTEKERSHFLQTQKRENSQNEPERVETQINNNKAEEILSTYVSLSSSSIPLGSESEQNEAAINLQSPNCEGDKRAEADVSTADTTSDGSSTVKDPGCSEKSCGAEGGTEPDPEETAEPTLDLPAEEKEEEEPMKDVTDGSVLVDQSPDSSSNLTHNEEAEEQGEFETACQEVNGVTVTTRDEKKEELTGDDGNTGGAPAGTSSTESQAGGLICGSVELCEAAVTSGGSEKDDSCEPEEDPPGGPSTVDAELLLTRETADPFRPGCLDYVSDSQLNTISLTEEELTEKEDGLAFQEDASDLICGLIRELSSLNRKVMNTHRQLESLRRCSKSSRSCTR